MKKGILGIAITLGTFLLILVIHKVLGGDAGQAKRSDWFPLLYILPVMVGLFIFFLASTIFKKK